jgi:ubiquinone/menaquinone biosynthesis C-methylase UbiE
VTQNLRIEQERFEVGKFMPPWVRHQHTTRYEWVTQFVGGKKVLDVACGTGYGAVLLAKAGAEKVDGFDCSKEAVDHASSRYSHPVLSFSVADAEHLPVSDAEYDVYVSFETVEHIQDDRAFLAEAARVLRPEGLFIVSTPNRDLLDPGTSIDQRPFNQFHVREYTRLEFEDRLREHFKSIVWFGQSRYLTSYVNFLGSIGRRSPGFAVKLHQARKCLGWPWESARRHTPVDGTNGSHVPEVHIALCRV